MNGRYVSFTVRVWARGGEIVRGEVLHVPSGESLRFIDPRTVLRFLTQQLAGEGPWEDEGSTDLGESPDSAEEAADGALASEGGTTREETEPSAVARSNK